MPGSVPSNTSAVDAAQGVQDYAAAPSGTGATATAAQTASEIALYPELANTMVPETLNAGPASHYSGRLAGPVDEQVSASIKMLQNLESGLGLGTGVKPQYVQNVIEGIKNASPSFRPDYSTLAGETAAQQLQASITKHVEPALAQLGIHLNPMQVHGGVTAAWIRQQPIPATTQSGLARVGYNPTQMRNVAEFTEAADLPGSVPGQAAGKPTHTSAASLYRNFQSQFGDGTSTLATQWISELTQAGLVNPDDVEQNSTQTYAHAYMDLLTQAAKGNVTPDQELATLSKAEPEVVATPDTAAVQNMADQMGVNLTPGQVNVYAQLYSSQGSTTEGDALIRAKLADEYVPPPDGAPVGWASLATNALNDAYSKYGVKLSPGQLEDLVKQSMAQSSANYQVTTQAGSLAETTAKNVASAQFPSIAPLIAQGQTTQQILDPYLQQASELLNVPVSSMNIQDPQWQAALRGGANGDSLMSSTDWANTVASDPVYNYASSLGAKQKATSLGMEVAAALGKAPSMPNAEGSQSTSTTGA